MGARLQTYFERFHPGTTDVLIIDGSKAETRTGADIVVLTGPFRVYFQAKLAGDTTKLVRNSFKDQDQDQLNQVALRGGFVVVYFSNRGDPAISVFQAAEVKNKYE